MKNKITQIVKSKIFEYILLTLIILLAFFVRLYKINSPIADWHSWRQADTASVSRIYAEKGINLLLPRYYDISSIQSGISNPNGFRMVEFPFYNAITALVVNAFPKFSLEVWSRLITITTALITSFFLYLIGRKLMGKWGGLLCAFFYLFIPFNIFFTRVILPDPMGVCFGVISLWAFFEFTYNDKKILLFVSSIFLSMALLIKPYLGFYIFPIIYLALRKYGIKKFLIDKKVIIYSALFCILAFTPFILWRMWEGRFPEGIPFYEWAFNGNLIRFKPSFWYWIFGERLGHLILGSLGLIPFVFGVVNTKIKNLFVHAFLAGALFYVVVVASANVMHDYYQILTIPVISMTLAAGTVYLWTTQIYNRILTRTITIISIGVMLITGWNQISGNYAINHPEIIEAGAEVDKIIPKDAIVIAPYGGDTAFLYQTKRFGWPVIDDSVDNIIKKGADYYVTVDLGSADTKMIEARFKTIEKKDKYIIVDLHQAIK
jgi:hypothetical protein